MKSTCSLAAFRCILRAAQQRLYLSDCHFFNFGLVVTEDATQHAVRIIDAGSRGIERGQLWKKSEVTTKVMRKFCAHCRDESATNHEIEHIYKKHHRLDPCLEKARNLWQIWPYMTRSARNSCTIWEEMRHKEAAQKAIVNASSAFKIVRIVGRWTAAENWDNAHAFVCYRAASTTKILPKHRLRLGVLT